MNRSTQKFLLIFAAVIFSALPIFGQSGHSIRGNADDGTVLVVTATRADGSKERIPPQELALYENGIEHKILNFVYDPSPSRIILLVDNSQTVQMDLEKMKAAVMEFAYEIFDGDQLYLIAYDEKPEIIQDWTDDAKKLEASMSVFRKKGNPHLFDALNASLKEVLQPLMPGTRKTAIVVIGDGLDRGSVSKFDNVLAELQNNNVTIYSLQLPDRTGGAFRRNQPKAGKVISGLIEGTGGLVFPLDEAQKAAKTICDELHHNRYLLSYRPRELSSYEPRRLLLMGNEGITTRTKLAQPPNIK